ncbi:MAG: hypothetical protein WB564_07140 [Dehalococcoidia bacterium]
MATIEESEAKKLCFELLSSETEDEVVDVLKKWAFWEDINSWKPYGNVQNNRGIVSNQQSSPVAALVEKLINSIDAVLTGECFKMGIEPASTKAPKTMQSAVEQFFQVKDGRIETLSASQRTNLAEMIVLIATGTKETPNYVIIDQGEGQSPDKFESTFLSLLRDNKTHIPFVQGKYNMGGTGVLQFSGKNSFQLIISKRQPWINQASPSLADKWGFTLTRRLGPNIDQPQSSYVFLAPNKMIPFFSNDSLELLPGKYPYAHQQPIQAGTCIKLWNYKFPGKIKSIATLDLRWALERYLQNPAIPIRISERRQGYRAHYYDTTMSGMLTVIADNPEDIEHGFDTGSPLDIPGIGHLELRLIVLKDAIDKDKYATGIFFNVNGQLHSDLGKDFISRKSGFDYVADSMIVIVDCTALPTIVREDLFMGSRDRMRQCEERQAIESSIGEYLKDHPGLRQLNALRRQNRTASAISDEHTLEIFQELVKGDPTLGSLFGGGEKLKLPTGKVPKPIPYEGLKFPTIFRIANEPKEGLIKSCPKNHSCRVEFETNAANDYFSRISERGHFSVKGIVAPLSSVHLWNGKASVRFVPPVGSNPGDRYSIQIEVTDPSRVDPFRSQFTMMVEPDAPPPPPHPDYPPKPKGSQLTGIPNIFPVTHDQWAKYGFDETSALAIKRGEEQQLDFFINMDNIYLKNEIARRKSTEKTLIEYYFKYGLSLLALGILHIKHDSIEKSEEETSEKEETEWPPQILKDEIAEICRGAAITIIPIIIQLGKITVKADV